METRNTFCETGFSGLLVKCGSADRRMCGSYNE